MSITGSDIHRRGIRPGGLHMLLPLRGSAAAILFLLAAILIPILCGCSEDKGGREITVTFAPQQWIVEEIAGDDFRVNVLLPPGSDPENFSPTVSGLRSLYDGGTWLTLATMGFEQSVLDNINSSGKRPRTINVARGIEPLEHTHACGGHHHDDEKEEIRHADPHLWSSVRNMTKIADNTVEALSALNPDSAASYRRRHALLRHRLAEMDSTLAGALRESDADSFLIRHPSMGYFARDYGLRQIAIEAEGKEPSANQLRRRLDMASEEGCRTFIYEESKGEEDMAREFSRQLRLRPLPLNLNSTHWAEEIMKLREL